MFQGPKRFTTPGFLAKNCRAPGLQDRKIAAVGPQGSIKQESAILSELQLGERLLGSWLHQHNFFGAPGLQRTPLWHLMIIKQSLGYAK